MLLFIKFPMQNMANCITNCSQIDFIYPDLISTVRADGGGKKKGYFRWSSATEASRGRLASTFVHSSKKTESRRMYFKSESEEPEAEIAKKGPERDLGQGMHSVEGEITYESAQNELEDRIEHGIEASRHCINPKTSEVLVNGANLLPQKRHVKAKTHASSEKTSRQKKNQDDFLYGDFMPNVPREQSSSENLSVASDLKSYSGYNVQTEDCEPVQDARDLTKLATTMDINTSNQNQVNTYSNYDEEASLEVLNQESAEGKVWDDIPEGEGRKQAIVINLGLQKTMEPAVEYISIDQTVEQVKEVSSESLVEQVVAVVDHVAEIPVQVTEKVSHVAGHVVQVGQKMVDQVSEVLPDSVVEQVSQVAEAIEQVALPAAEQMITTAVQAGEQVSGQVINFLAFEDDGDDESDDEFEAYKTTDLPEFRGIQGHQNFTVLQDNEGVLSKLYDFYTFMLKKPLPEFALGMFTAPILLSLMFTLLYLPELHGLVLDETARTFFESSGMPNIPVLELTFDTVFQVFMFSLSLSTGLQPELVPLSPYTLVIANLNALIAQLILVFLSGAVFARLSQPSQPVRCSTVAVICPKIARQLKQPPHRTFMVRFVLAGPQPCELVDVKVDLSFRFNTITRSGSYFRATHSLKLNFRGSLQIRPEIAYLNHGMLVRHIIDETSPLYHRTTERLKKEDAIFVLSVIGLERSSMQSVFHVQNYSVNDNHVIWNAEFEDMILISKKNKRIVDHSKLSQWKPFALYPFKET